MTVEPTLLPPLAPVFTGSQPAPALDPVPAPWALTGEGWVLLYWLSAVDAAGPGILRPELRGAWRSGPAAVAFMRYHSSAVGPYDELLFIPGLAEIDGRRAFTISQIYVSSAASVVSGRANWGIPKDEAEFRIVRCPTGEDVLSAGPAGAPFAELIARPAGPRLPLNTTAFPLPLAQVWEGGSYRLGLTVRARARWLDVIRWRADGAHFPALAARRPLGALKLDQFAITFPVAAVEAI